jgi:hypothetical protein
VTQTHRLAEWAKTSQLTASPAARQPLLSHGVCRGIFSWDFLHHIPEIRLGSHREAASLILFDMGTPWTSCLATVGTMACSRSHRERVALFLLKPRSADATKEVPFCAHKLGATTLVDDHWITVAQAVRHLELHENARRKARGTLLDRAQERGHKPGARHRLRSLRLVDWRL